MITKIWEIVCDNCGCAEHEEGCTKGEANYMFRETGGIITRDGKYLCSTNCRWEYYAKEKTD